MHKRVKRKKNSEAKFETRKESQSMRRAKIIVTTQDMRNVVAL